MPYTDRVDYIAAMFANQGWAIAVREADGHRGAASAAQYLRVISCELNRIASHLIALGAMAMDIGAVTPFPYALREREYINDLLEELCGARLTYNYHRIGGVAFDMPDGLERQGARRWLDHFEPIIDEFDRLITYNEIFVKRLANMAPIPPQRRSTTAWSGRTCAPPASNFDVRKRRCRTRSTPSFEFDVPVGKGEIGHRRATAGTASGCRVEEMRASRCSILRQALEQDCPRTTQIWARCRRSSSPKGEAYARVESARGDMDCYVVGDGARERATARASAPAASPPWASSTQISRGLMVADLVALIASLDVVAPEIDR